MSKIQAFKPSVTATDMGHTCGAMSTPRMEHATLRFHADGGYQNGMMQDSYAFSTESS
jgi:hypothetical protein